MIELIALFLLACCLYLIWCLYRMRLQLDAMELDLQGWKDHAELLAAELRRRDDIDKHARSGIRERV